MKVKPIPKSILNALGRGPWRCRKEDLNKFVTWLTWHAEGDKRDGVTCAYRVGVLGDSLTAVEMSSIVKEGAIQPEMHRNGCVNQHWLHSLEQFYAECSAAWNAHVRRTDALIGTPAGTITGTERVTSNTSF